MINFYKCFKVKVLHMKYVKERLRLSRNFLIFEIDGRSSNKSDVEKNDAEITKKKEEKVIHSFCSFQSRVGPPEYRKWRRIHGLQLPLHPQQIAGWIILVAIGATTFFVLIPALRPFFREGLYILLGTLFLLHILSHLTALLLDPADPELRSLKIKFTIPEFDRSKHAHVIENGRCHLCNIKTSSSKTKHCSVCNKCIDHFDHHCKWLNHCIGKRNYVPFLICVISAVVASLVIVGVSVLEVVYYHIDPELLGFWSHGTNNNNNNNSIYPFLPNFVFLGVIIILGIISATIAGLLLHLCLFHCYISILGISTYEYIRNYRNEGSESSHRNIVIFNCFRKKKKEVMSNQLDGIQKTNDGTLCGIKKCSRYNCSYCSNGKEKNCCIRTKLCFTRTKYFLKNGETGPPKPLSRQNTDPEFIDKVIKPFLITLNDERTTEIESDESKFMCSRFYSVNEKTQAETCKCENEKDCVHLKKKTSKENENEEIKKKTTNKTILYSVNLHSWFSKVLNGRPGVENTTTKVKNNQIQPSIAEELNRYSNDDDDDENAIKNYSDHVDLKSFMTIKNKVLPELNESVVGKLKNSVDVKKLNSSLELRERPESEFAIQVSMKSANYRKIRKKNVLKKSRSPILSPIRESGLSNPGSPRENFILPQSPVFYRPPSPETSMIFLSNPNSSSSSSSSSSFSSSDDDDDDDDEVVVHSNPMINRHYKSEEILQTPQLPRKIYSSNMPDDEQQIFVLKPSKVKSKKWIDVKIKN
ncbi:zinc finger protein DHHC domain containing protein, putative [Pediculus humanus corporis]|uniref:Palmitoyltransferase n=1 Tax=Pediculus humanus subsp. corporis TaxID=121224 RepID=E0V9M1_PEDHC|nr:zinc finger protein DHHC domain containing protein, putative [Pediculus humanus corporis]EEB10077.1 zinc finger protein DHHC domain containing protein, putative [Pediculus humanus corporis]